MSAYRTVLAEGRREDLISLLNKGLPLAQWPVPRKVISRHIVGVREAAFPELVEQAATGA